MLTLQSWSKPELLGGSVALDKVDKVLRLEPNGKKEAKHLWISFNVFQSTKL